MVVEKPAHSDNRPACSDNKPSRSINNTSSKRCQVRVNLWHFAMLNDDHRNLQYDVAIRNAVSRARTQTKSARVIDIGSGSGVLSMMAARVNKMYLVFNI